MRAEGLVFRYPGSTQPAVDGVSLVIHEGELLGLLGPNGTGKTTTISLLATLLRPGEGTLEVCGIDALKAPEKVRPFLGLVPQDIALYPSLTARENLRYFGRLYGLSGASLDLRVEECLDWVGLPGHGDRRVEFYSGGMKRRANLAAGIIHRPRLLFLDEPTVGIDAQSRNTIFENLARLREEGTTMVYTTHYMEEAEDLCTRIAIMDAGKIIADAAPGALLEPNGEHGSLEALYLHLTGSQLRD